MTCLMPAESRVTHQPPTIFQDTLAGRTWAIRKRTSRRLQSGRLTTGRMSVPGTQRPCRHASNMSGVEGRPAVAAVTSQFDPTVWTGRALQAESDDLEVIGLALLYPALE